MKKPAKFQVRINAIHIAADQARSYGNGLSTERLIQDARKIAKFLRGR